MTEIKTLLSVKDLEKRWGLSHSFLYALIKKGQLKSCKIGKRRLFIVDHVREFEKSLSDSITADPAEGITKGERGEVQ